MARGDPADGKTERAKEVLVSPGGRPLDYRGSEGCFDRIISRTLAAGGVGAGAGMLVALARGQPALQLTASVAANCALAASCFCGAQEVTRELRAADPEDWVNCVLAGLASGALLGHLQGPKRALPCALLFAGVGTGAQLGVIQFREYRLRHFLATVSSETVTGQPVSLPQAALKEKETGQEQVWWKWPDWAPIQKLDEEEALKRAQEKQQKLRDTLEGLHSGAFFKDQRP